MPYLPDAAKQIAKTGANIVIDARDYLPDTARDIIRIANSAGGHATLLNSCHYLPDKTKSIATAGGKNVTIHLVNNE